jgi:hypothetical protein
MLKHYSHIRMEAKRRAVNALSGGKATEQMNGRHLVEPAKESAKVDPKL